MPLVQFELRNEYGLGAQELYKDVSEEEPKALLEGVAVAGLVGILRQLGDLAEFAAEVFHGLQEQLAATSARSHKMIVRVQQIEAALPQLERAVLGQKSHIHFAYTTGCEWHPKVRTKQKHLSHSDLPRFLMDSYEECRDPPCLKLLDKFDSGGPGACLRRYSDPSFFRKASNSSGSLNAQKEPREKKVRKIKKQKKTSRQRYGQVSLALPISQWNGSLSFTSPKSYEQSSACETSPMIHVRAKSELGNQPTSYDPRSRSGYIECNFGASSPMQYDDQEHNRLSTSESKRQLADATDSLFSIEEERAGFDYLGQDSLQESNPSSVTWDEKTEIVRPKNHQKDDTTVVEGNAAKLLPEIVDPVKLEIEDTMVRNVDSGSAIFDGINFSEGNDQKVDSIECESDVRNVDSGSAMFDGINFSEGNDQKVDSIECESDAAKLQPELADIVKLEVEDNMLRNVDSEVVNLEVDDNMLRNVDSEGTMLAGETLDDSFSEVSQFEETGSETEKYMDALNTLESEAETDSESRTKREADQTLANIKNVGMTCGSVGIHEMSSVNSKETLVEFEDESNSSSSKQPLQNFADLVPSEDLVHAHSPEATSSFNSNILVDPDYHASNGFDLTRMDGCESAIDLSSSSFRVPDSEDCFPGNITGSLCDCQDSPKESTDEASVKVWTNGGLLGLAPSKPPDWSAQDIDRCNSVACAMDNDSHGLSNNIVKSECQPNESARKLNVSVMTQKQTDENLSEEGRDRLPDTVSSSDIYFDERFTRTRNRIHEANTRFSTSYNGRQENGIAVKNLLDVVCAFSESKLEKSEDSCETTNLTSAYERDRAETSLLTPQGDRAVISGVKSGSKEANYKDIQSSLRMFDLGQNASVNGFQMKGSLPRDDSSKPPGFVKTGLTEPNESPYIQWTGKRKITHHISNVHKPNEQLGNESPVNSLPSSPPLEHMRISFHPIDNFETSKLRLKFPGGHHFHETIKDVMFPSFQLLPGPGIPLQDYDSDSENDAFCRSRSYTPEDLMSHHSESNSEEWESDEIPRSKDQEIHDALCSVSSADSILNAFEIQGIDHDSIQCDSNFRSSDANNDLQPFYSDPLFDLPSFDSVTSASQQEKICTNANDCQDSELRSPHQPTPDPPPLPPVGWRVTKPQFDVPENEQDTISKSVSLQNDLQVMEVIPSQQPIPAPPEQPNFKEFNACLWKNRDQQKYGREETAQVANSKGVDEREDLLNQIRTKSFRLRRTVPARSTLTSDSTTNTKVTAMLEKANAIRQAYVGNDEGGDNENWSDG